MNYLLFMEMDHPSACLVHFTIGNPYDEDLKLAQTI